jgi:hypothetical protein
MNEFDLESEFQVVLNDIATEILQIYRQQVPSPSNNPDPTRLKRTGRLRSSLSYRILNNNTVSFYYLRYGVYVDFGTGSLFNQGAANTTNPFGLPAYREYSRGFGGIQPQYWTSLAGYERIIDNLEGRLADIIENGLKTTTERNLEL